MIVRPAIGGATDPVSFSNGTEFTNFRRLVVGLNFFAEQYDDINNSGNGSYQVSLQGIGIKAGEKDFYLIPECTGIQNPLSIRQLTR